MSNRKHAEELANRPYSEMALRDRTTDDDFLYVAMTPELEGCIVQGETMREALDNLQLFRIDYIEHLLDNDLPVPDPAWAVTQTEGTPLVLPTENSVLTLEEMPHQERPLGFQLKVENGAIEHS